MNETTDGPLQTALAGKVAIITGASRGIGRALALGLARAGCSIVVAAKSTTSSERLPGSIYSVAAEVEALGVPALPVAVDVRDADAIENMVMRTVEQFGRIDVLINNAGALFWENVLETPPRRFDLVMNVNARAAFLCSRAVLPTMIRQRQGHIINMSPPLDLSILPGRVAYGISKLGMTLLTLGLAEEVRPHNIAVNSLWPVTIIESQASINHNLGTAELWRKPDILVDCVLRLAARKPDQITGQTLLDEEFLRREGVTDFSGYACVPGTVPPHINWTAFQSNPSRPGREPLRIGIVTSSAEKLSDYFPTQAEPLLLPTEPPLTPDDQLAVDELRRRGHLVLPVVWGGEPTTLRESIDHLIVRSPWDYMDSEQQCRDFIRWIEALGQAGVVVDNPPEVMAWLLDKRYLLDLESVGVPIVPTHYAHPGSAALLGQAFSGSLVVKPAISAAGAGLVALEGRTEIEQFQSEFARLNQETAYLIQPLLPEIRTAGEWSLIYLGGQYSHAIHKVPGVGTVLCHAERGGSLRFATPPEPVRAVGDALVAKLPQAFTARYPERTGESGFPLLYLRVDIIESAAGALISECEGVEPELFFRACPGSEKRFADLVEARTGQRAERG